MADFLDQRYVVEDLKNIVWREVDGETVLLNLSSGAYYSLNSTATMLWDCITENRSLAETVAEIADSFGVDKEVVVDDANELVALMIDSEVIRQA